MVSECPPPRPFPHILSYITAPSRETARRRLKDQESKGRSLRFPGYFGARHLSVPAFLSPSSLTASPVVMKDQRIKDLQVIVLSSN